MSFLYDKKTNEPFRISRSKIDLFLKCPRCFYLDRVLGISRPSMPGFSLNNAVDNLLKNEFDYYRERGEAHPLMKQYKIDAVPFKTDKITEWRDALHRGAKVIHKPTNLLITGGIDDIWENKNEELMIVDYKATSTDKEISLDDEYKESYKKQVEIYQWIYRNLKYKVSDTAYFVYCNGIKDKEKLDNKLEFYVSIISYIGNAAWVEPTLFEIKRTLDLGSAPEPSSDCEHCNYVLKINNIVK
jgi:hypothetical protein